MPMIMRPWLWYLTDCNVQKERSLQIIFYLVTFFGFLVLKVVRMDYDEMYSKTKHQDE